MESHSKEVEAGRADEKQLLLGCSMANGCLPQQRLSEAFREGKSQSWEREGTGSNTGEARVRLPMEIFL